MGRSREELAIEFLCSMAERELALPLVGRGRKSVVCDLGAKGLKKDGEAGLSGLMGDFLERMKRAHSWRPL